MKRIAFWVLLSYSVALTVCTRTTDQAQTRGEDENIDGSLEDELLSSVFGEEESETATPSTPTSLPPYIVELGNSLQEHPGEHERTPTRAEEDAERVENGFSATVFVMDPIKSQEAVTASTVKISFHVNPRNLQELQQASLRLFWHGAKSSSLWVTVDVQVNEQLSVPVSSVDTHGAPSSKWLVLNVTSAVAVWREHRLTSDPINHDSSWNILTFSFLLATDRGGRPSGKSVNEFVSLRGDNSPLLTVLLPEVEEKDFELITPLLIERFRHHFSGKQRSARSTVPVIGPRWVQLGKSPCFRHNFHITKELVSTSKRRIVAPREIPFHICHGHCDFPLISKSNATVNALIRSLLKVRRPNLHLPNPVCTAISYAAPIHVVEETNKSFKTSPPFRRLTVKDCGCR